MRPSDLAARARRIGLKQCRLAELADLDENTVGRALRHREGQGGGPYRSTWTKLEAVIAAQEKKALLDLVRLHPQAAMDAVTVGLCPEIQTARAAA